MNCLNGKRYDWPPRNGNCSAVYEVRVTTELSAAHQLRLYEGELEPLHDHAWKVEAVFRGPELDRIGVLIDFVTVKKVLDDILKPLHGQNLNESALLAGVNPSAEQLAYCVFMQLRQRLGDPSYLKAVYVREAPGCIAAYWEELPNPP